MKPILYLFVIFLVLNSCKQDTSESTSKSPDAVVELPQISDEIKVNIDSVILRIATTSKSRMKAVIISDSTQAYYSGYDGRTNSKITDFGELIEIGSNTKMFTATSILQLIEQGKVSLDQPVTDILTSPNLDDLLVVDGKSYIDSVKVYQLLNHTSGIPDYFREVNDEKEIEIHGDPSLKFSAEDLLKMAKQLNKEPFVPGEKFHYSNTNYTLLGMIIEQVSGQTYQDYFQEHIIERLNLENTYLASEDKPSNKAQGFYKGKEVEMPLSFAGAAGELVTDLDAMTTFIDGWHKGQLFEKPETLKMVLNDYYNNMGSGVLYGLGVINLLQMSYGHGGQTFGFQTYMAALPNGYRFAFAIDDGFVSSWEAAILFSSALTSPSELE